MLYAVDDSEMGLSGCDAALAAIETLWLDLLVLLDLLDLRESARGAWLFVFRSSGKSSV